MYASVIDGQIPWQVRMSCPPDGVTVVGGTEYRAVDALASRWGVEPLGHSGKSVSVELRR
jgi:hypothetical protein